MNFVDRSILHCSPNLHKLWQCNIGMGVVQGKSRSEKKEGIQLGSGIIDPSYGSAKIQSGKNAKSSKTRGTTVPSPGHTEHLQFLDIA